MTNPAGTSQTIDSTETASAAAAEAAFAATVAAEETAASAEAAAAAASARARTSAAEAAAAEATAAAAKAAAFLAAGSSGAAGVAASAVMPGLKPTHVKAPEWAGPDGYMQYQEDVDVWLHMTRLPEDKKGGAVRLALTGVAQEAGRNLTVAQVTSSTGRKILLACLQLVFAGSEAQRGHDAYRSLKTLYRGSKTMKEYLYVMGQALIQCRMNGYSMSSKTAAAVVLDHDRLEGNQKASTMAAAVVIGLKGKDTLNAMTTALRDLWGGESRSSRSPTPQ
eukprot:TRINITY_DN1729_c0_g1_i4.p3 TRINITY_DN1729_c0_g1~~TRINITY_DN1729_c0_g1_i4.p3  ORF type:complete len:279 (-),score=63.28 TRINITY_DN1729_c0_g1_i4:4844-5680(-)